MRRVALALMLAVPAAVMALATEQIGNAPVVRQDGWADGVLEAINQPSRVYGRWVNGNEMFYFRGDATALNAALRAFAAVKAKQRVVVLRPGRGRMQTFAKTEVPYGWELHVPSGIYRAVSGQEHAVMTVYVNARRPRATVDRKKVTDLVRQLDDDSFEVRTEAARKLEGMGRDIKPLLHEVLVGGLELDARRRIEALLGRMGELDASDLRVPKGVTVQTATDAIEANLKAIDDPNSTKRSLAMYALEDLAGLSDQIVPAFAVRLGAEHKDARRTAAACLGRIGAAARPALPALRAAKDDPDANVRKEFADAVERIEAAKADDAEAKRRRAILADLDEWKVRRSS